MDRTDPREMLRRFEQTVFVNANWADFSMPIRLRSTSR